MRAALAALSTIRTLTDLEVFLDERGGVYSPEMDYGQATPPVGAFAQLKRLQIDGRTTSVAAVISVIVAPKLEAVELACGDWHWDPETRDTVLVEDALTVIFNHLRRRTGTTLRKFHLSLREYSGELFPKGTAPGTRFPISAGPLLGLCRLEDVMIHQYRLSGDREYLCINVPALVAAWPTLRFLTLPGLAVNMESLQVISRTCTRLERLTAKCLSWSWFDVPGAMEGRSFRLDTAASDTIASALRELRFEEPLKAILPDTASNVARLLDSLFPQLIPERCSVVAIWTSRRQPEVRETYDVMDIVARLQRARRDASMTADRMLDGPSRP
ncbi:uncharacterized protein B0H18DRAFT_1029396 [Fomitopsis serialis]|uniref:uncharacterized protein n=1 Tax=Fomitopsis serialis TaxID=139415 RepID=UPI002008A8B3|nr:uncharacterized protein B0H18DRAFT_1029396 [Neoantrodia serialis]KAH9919016.1 hypothetical protein B0H18DRAFT_1029396 [Neoantrodia serialis]